SHSSFLTSKSKERGFTLISIGGGSDSATIIRGENPKCSCSTTSTRSSHSETSAPKALKLPCAPLTSIPSRSKRKASFPPDCSSIASTTQEAHNQSASGSRK